MPAAAGLSTATGFAAPVGLTAPAGLAAATRLGAVARRAGGPCRAAALLARARRLARRARAAAVRAGAAAVVAAPVALARLRALTRGFARGLRLRLATVRALAFLPARSCRGRASRRSSVHLGSRTVVSTRALRIAPRRRAAIGLRSLGLRPLGRRALVLLTGSEPGHGA